MVSWMRGAPMARDCWEGHRPHAILTALTARLLRWAGPHYWRPASCAGRWAAGWATATTWRVVEKQGGCGGGERRGGGRSEQSQLRAGGSCYSRQAGMDMLLPKQKGSRWSICVASGRTSQRHGRSSAGAVVRSLDGSYPDWRRASAGQPPDINDTGTRARIDHNLYGTRHTAQISNTRPIAPPASSVPAATTRTLLPASSTTSESLEAPTTPRHIPRTPYHNVDQSAPAVPARRPHQALAA